MVDALDSKSSERLSSCRFDSDLRHHMIIQSNPKKYKSPRLITDCGLFVVYYHPVISIDSRGYKMGYMGLRV